MSYAQWTWENVNKVGATFINQAIQYQDDPPHDGKDCPFGPPPDVGDERTSKILEITLRLSGDVHELIGLSAFEHGQRLQSAALTYRDTDGNVTDQIFKLAVGAAGGQIPPDGEIPGHHPNEDEARTLADGTVVYDFMPRFPAPEVQQPWLPTFDETFIPGDVNSMYELAYQLNTYVTNKGSETFDTLLHSVTGLIESDIDPDDGYHSGPDGTWIGPAAYAFRNAWVTCGAMMNGLNITYCEIAKIVGQGAQELASLESDLEAELTRLLQASPVRKYFARTPDITWFQALAVDPTVSYPITVPEGATTVLGINLWGRQNIRGRSVPVVRTMLETVNTAYFAYLQQADRVRTDMATRLAGQAEILLDAVNYYNTTKGTGGTGGEQISVVSFNLASGDATNMQNDLRAELKGLNSTKGDINAVAADLNGIGSLAGSAGTILNDVQDIKNLETTASVLAKGTTYLNLAGDALPVLATIGMPLLA